MYMNALVMVLPGKTITSAFVRIGGCVKSFFMALRAELYFERGCVKRFFTALRAELCFVRHIIFLISLREIRKMMCLTK